MVSRTAMMMPSWRLALLSAITCGPHRKKSFGTPSEAAVQFVVHDFGQRGGVNLAGHERLAGRKGFTDGVVKPIVPFLTEVEAQVDHDENGEDDRTGDGELL